MTNPLNFSFQKLLSCYIVIKTTSQIIIKVLGVTPGGGAGEQGTCSLSAKHGTKSHEKVLKVNPNADEGFLSS